MIPLGSRKARTDRQWRSGHDNLPRPDPDGLTDMAFGLADVAWTIGRT
jgi:hypothetical protein